MNILTAALAVKFWVTTNSTGRRTWARHQFTTSVGRKALRSRSGFSATPRHHRGLPRQADAGRVPTKPETVSLGNHSNVGILKGIFDIYYAGVYDEQRQTLTNERSVIYGSFRIAIGSFRTFAAEADKLSNLRWTRSESTKHTRRRVKYAAVSVFLLLPLMAACGSSDGGSSGDGAAKESITVVNGITSFEFMAASMAEELGIWDKIGLDVNYIRGSGGGGQVTTTLTANQADLGLHGGAAAAVSIEKGQPARIIASTSPSFSGFPCVVKKDSSIQSFADLKGKTMGISSAGSLTDLMGRMIAKKYGWTLGKEFKQAKIGDLSQLTAALDQGVVDIICWSAEPALTLVDKGQGRILGDSADIIGPNIYESIEATEEAIKKKPEAIKLYLKGYFTAVQYMKDHPDETIKFLAKFASLSENVARQVYELRMPDLSLDGAASESMLKGLTETAGTLSGRVPPVEEVWDDQFVPVKIS